MKNNLSFVFKGLERFFHIDYKMITFPQWLPALRRVIVVVAWGDKKETPDPARFEL